MIRVQRSTAALSDAQRRKFADGLLRLRELIKWRPLRRNDFDSALYAADEVKTALWNIQFHKCCFCEREYERRFAAVEHFRPKSEAVRTGGIRQLGYWWLAYHFNNLYFICPNCNTSKGSKFPLAPESRGLAAEEDPEVVEERHLLLDPGFGDDPELHLTFVWLPRRGYQIAPRDGSARGRSTIEVLKLDRDDLYEIRKGYYRRCLQPLIERFAACRAAGDQDGLAQVIRQATAHAAPDAPFALLARTAFRDAGIQLMRSASKSTHPGLRRRAKHR